MNKAIIFIDAKSDDNKEEPLSFLKVGGLGLAERQLRQLKKLNVDHVYLMSFSMPEKLHQCLSQFKNSVKTIEVVDANFTDTAFWDGFDSALLVEEGRLIDQRILNTVVTAQNKNALALFEEGAVMFGEDAGLMVDVNGTKRLFASCALVDGASLKAASLSSDYKTNPVASIINNMVAEGRSVAVNVSELDPYITDMRRDVPILWRPISNRGECGRASKLLIEYAQKGVLSWPARFIHPIFEDTLVYYSLPTFLTSNILTIGAMVTGFYVAYLFYVGLMGVALSGAMLLGVVYGVRDKLAVVKEQSSKHGGIEHILDNIVEYAWYLSMAIYFSNVSGSIDAWAVGLLIILFSWASVVQSRFFRCLTDQQLDDTGVFERAFKLISAGRNTRVWALSIFALTQKWEAGFWLLAVYTMITFFISQWRFIVRTKGYASKVSEAMADNITKTRFFD